MLTFPNSQRADRHQSIAFYDLHPPLEDFQTEVLQGLQQPQKTISPKFLYDQRGAKLFEAICDLEEYYLTRAETAILQTRAGEIAEQIGAGVLIEFGSGSCQKIRLLLDAATGLETYVALDISKQHLYSACEDLAKAYPSLETIAICTDYTQPWQLPDIASISSKPKIGFFPGSSIGNLDPSEALKFLKQAATLLRPNGGLLIGVDLKKDQQVLEAAYDDAEGVSAAFALNLLSRINRELDADFNLNQFCYRSFYNPVGRIEMYIVSLTDQRIQIGNTEISFRAGETLRTEYSYKYSIEEFQTLAASAGFRPTQVWTDPQQLFSLHWLKV